ARSEVKAEGAAEPRARSGIRILVVDDEPAVLDVSRRILERLGYQVQVAADAAEGIRSVEMDEPDLLVSDVMMPGQSGPSMVATLRRAGFEMPVLYVSGYTGDELTRTGTLDSDTALLQKPYTPRELGQRIDQMLDSLPG